MKTYLTIIKKIQFLFLAISIGILALLPTMLATIPDHVPTALLFALAHTSLFFVMVIRPLADILPPNPYVRPLVILRKGVGVFSASLIVSFMLSKLMVDPSGFVQNFFTLDYWSWSSYALLAHSADIAAVLLLITSNNLSKRLLGKGWKRIQRLSYVYFYASGLYVYLSFGDTLVLGYLITVSIVTTLAYIHNRHRATS